MSSIIYTKTDEAPALATRSLFPVVKAFAATCGIEMTTKDISLAARVLAKFPEYLNEEQQVEDALKVLGEMVLDPNANIIKLPNISASVPQLKATIEELQGKGYNIPDYPLNPENEKEEKIKQIYDTIKGSAVNPVLREGNSNRRAPRSVKAFARKHPHSMGEWSSQSKSHVSSMKEGDFFHNEKSVTLKKDAPLTIVLKKSSGEEEVLKDTVEVEDGDIMDASLMEVKKLNAFLAEQVKEAKEQGVLFSIHMKATMMKVSDPIIFGHAVEMFFADVFDRYKSELEEVGVNLRNGLGDVFSKLEKLPESKREEIQSAFNQAIQEGPDLAMVNSDNGITNLHVPSDVIIDASMPAMIRTSGKMWNKNNETQDAKAVIPDSSYSGIYQTTIDFCKKHGAFDPTTMGSVSNIGLMAKKAEEYGSHDKTFEIQEDGKVMVIDSEGNELTSHDVAKGDIWRMCLVKDIAVKDWVGLAVRRARVTGLPTVFWLDENRPHDRELIKKVKRYTSELDVDGLDLPIMDPVSATQFSLERIIKGEDTISVTGNVLRDYLTDLFPILELGTSAKMLSIVPLMNGGGLFETGAGGSAPKHVQQLIKENHLRWDSLGEFLALSVSFKYYHEQHNNPKALILADCLDKATTKLLMNEKSPLRKVKQRDNRGSHYYLALYWSQELSEQNEDIELKEIFTPIAAQLLENEEQVGREVVDIQGGHVDLGGYYLPDDEKANRAMRPSETFNRIIEQAFQMA